MLFNSVQNFSQNFVSDILDGMYDWVRVIDRDKNIILMNKAMCEGLGKCQIGKKCYELIGRTEPCEICISRDAVFDGKSHEKQEIINGRIFSVMSSPVKNKNNEIVAVVEVLRDVTHIHILHNKIMEQNERLRKDLVMSEKIQLSLLPKEYDDEKISFSYIFHPCGRVGGDFLDFFRIDENHIGVYIADVQGHGVPASMLTVFLKSSLNKKLLSPAEALRQLFNDFNQNEFDTQLYITVFYAIINTQTGTVTYSNAGLNVAPVIFGQDRFEILRTPGIPISCWLEHPEYVDKETHLSKGDIIFLYTDGLPEFKNPAGEQFGKDRLLNIVFGSRGARSQECLKNHLSRLLDSVTHFAGAENLSEAHDDITAAMLLFK